MSLTCCGSPIYKGKLMYGKKSYFILFVVNRPKWYELASDIFVFASKNYRVNNTF
jgi:hypothetical protein